MEPQYFAQVTDGIVTNVRLTTKSFMDDNPEIYPGFWVLVESMDKYPAIGWSWSIDTGFMPPPSLGE